jgi:hypothetical protein
MTAATAASTEDKVLINSTIRKNFDEMRLAGNTAFERENGV